MIAALYDIHGNLPALEATLLQLERRGITELIIGGDVIPGPLPNECLDCIKEFSGDLHLIKGNCEDMVLAVLENRPLPKVPEEVRTNIEWTAANLKDRHIEWIQSWPATFSKSIKNIGTLLFCHATPISNTHIFTKDTPSEQLSFHFENINADIVVCGHTHMQFDRTIGNLRVINAGSVGMPFGPPGAYYLTVTPELQLNRLEYDVEKAGRLIKKSKYPSAQSFAEKNVLHPPSEESMLELLSGMGKT